LSLLLLKLARPYIPPLPAIENLVDARATLILGLLPLSLYLFIDMPNFDMFLFDFELVNTFKLFPFSYFDELILLFGLFWFDI